MGGGNQQQVPSPCAPGLTTESRGAVLREPLFLFALAVLVLNDHYLKGAGLLPGWLTGKLSDFAGLIVAPLLLVELVRARQRQTRLLCFAAVSIGFAALELSPELARGVEHLARAVHLSWRLWPDRTDLLALSVLPLAWRVSYRAHRNHAWSGRASWWVERLLLATASFACVATSENGERYFSAISLVSKAQEDIELQVFRPATRLVCDAVEDDPERLLTPADFVLEECATVPPLDLFPLDIDAGYRLRGTPLPASHRACDAVLLRAPGLKDTVVFWNDVPQQELDTTSEIPDDTSHLVLIESVGRQLFASPPPVGIAFAASSGPEAAACEVSP